MSYELKLKYHAERADNLKNALVNSQEQNSKLQEIIKLSSSKSLIQVLIENMMSIDETVESLRVLIYAEKL